MGIFAHAFLYCACVCVCVAIEIHASIKLEDGDENKYIENVNIACKSDYDPQTFRVSSTFIENQFRNFEHTIVPRNTAVHIDTIARAREPHIYPSIRFLNVTHEIQK